MGKAATGLEALTFFLHDDAYFLMVFGAPVVSNLFFYILVGWQKFELFLCVWLRFFVILKTEPLLSSTLGAAWAAGLSCSPINLTILVYEVLRG